MYRVSQKKWYTFKNAVIRNGKQVDLIFLHKLDKWLEDSKQILSLLPLSSADLWRKYAFLSKMVEKNSLRFFETDHFRCILPKNSIPGAKNSLK